ncbi:MAG: CPBP family intramembrane metalloprotease [Opitutaceae bacterium]|nr:CPBP family intramembrane metalloprotease [Opitutaceae bacterium]MBP9912500.1 CPBP family intramembrane metalloprotease [Opitutaceae bacterium]
MIPSAPASKTTLFLTWFSVLIGSALPELALGFRYPLDALHWLALSKAALLIGALFLTFPMRNFRPLRLLLIVLLTIHAATGVFGSVVSSGYWKELMRGIENPFIRTLLNVQFVRVGVALIVVAALLVIFRSPSRFFLVRGHMGATASRVAWLGISGAGGWNRLGLILTAILSLGTLAFLASAMRPAFVALPNLISMLPAIILFAATNALGEEIIYRLALLAPMANLAPTGQAMIMSATYFGLAHYYGIPSGSLGVVMAGFLGWLACRSVVDTKGVAWAFILHFVQDIWIFWFMAAMFSLHKA